MEPHDVASREFAVVLRGYSRDDVRAFMALLAAEVAERDARIATLEGEIARRRPAPAPDEIPATGRAETGRTALLHRLGQETAAILEEGDISAERLRAEAEATAERVRRGLAAIRAGLSDTHRLLGELVGAVHHAAGEGSPPAPQPPPYESLLAMAEVEILRPDDSELPRFG